MTYSRGMIQPVKDYETGLLMYLAVPDQLNAHMMDCFYSESVANWYLDLLHSTHKMRCARIGDSRAEAFLRAEQYAANDGESYSLASESDQ